MPKKLTTVPDLQNLNTTELWHMAARMGIQGATPAVPREDLIEAIQNLEHIPMVDPTEADRLRSSDFWIQHWDKVQMQMPKGHCPNCHLRYGMKLESRMDGREVESFCSDMEFVDCFLENKHRLG